MSKVRVNPKLIISQYYDSLINLIDIHTEELLDIYDENDLLEMPEDVYCTSRSEQKVLQAKERELIPGATNSWRLPQTYEVDSIRDPYKLNFSELFDNLKSNYEFCPSRTKTRDYLNKTREKMIGELEKAQAHTFAYYESIKDKLKLDERQGSREEVIDQIKSDLFATKFPCLIRVDRIHILGQDIEENPSLFKLYLFMFDFYINKQDMNLIRYYSIYFKIL